MIVRPLALLLPKRARESRAAAPRGRSARRAVLWGTAMVLLAHAGLAVALETVLPQLRDPEYGYRLVRARALQREHPDRPLVLVLGTSRTANGIDPSAAGFPDAPGSPLLFNFGLSGGYPVHLRARLAALRADGVNPGAVLVELFPATLVSDVRCAPAAPKLTAADLRRLEPELADPAALRRAWRAARLDPWQAQRVVIVSHVCPGMLPWSQRLDHYWANTDRFGFDAYPLHKSVELRPSRLAASQKSYSGALRELRVGAASDRAVRALIADCRATGTRVAFFTTPESPTFRGWYAAESRATAAAYLRGLSAELSCPVFEAPDDYSEEDFADGHHMLPHAAARFTRHLTEQHIKPWLAAEGRK